MDEQDFKKAIDNIHKDIEPTLRFNPQAKLIFRRTMNSLNEEIVMAIKQAKRQSTKGIPMSQIIQEAVQPILGDQLAKQAFAYAEKDKERFLNGELLYKPVAKEQQIDHEMNIRHKKMINEFITGFTLVFEDHVDGGNVNLTRDVRNFGGEILTKLVTSLVAKANTQKTGGLVTPRAIKWAVDNVFPPGVAEHANAEGVKLNLCYTNKLIDFEPPKTKPLDMAETSEVYEKSHKPATRSNKKQEMSKDVGKKLAKTPSALAKLPTSPGYPLKRKVSSVEKVADAKRQRSTSDQYQFERGVDLLMGELNAVLKPDSRRALVEYMMNMAEYLASHVPKKSGPVTVDDISAALQTMLEDGELRNHAEVMAERTVAQYRSQRK